MRTEQNWSHDSGKSRLPTIRRTLFLFPYHELLTFHPASKNHHHLGTTITVGQKLFSQSTSTTVQTNMRSIVWFSLATLCKKRKHTDQMANFSVDGVDRIGHKSSQTLRPTNQQDTPAFGKPSRASYLETPSVELLNLD